MNVTTTLSRPDGSTAPPADPPSSRLRPRHALLGVLLVATAALYLWDLSASGWGNAFYAAASQAGGVSWKAWFFGSSDAANLITVDKTPAALWVSGLSVRIFGLSSWSVLAPQALIGVASVALLYASVSRTAGTAAGLLAGATLALTPVAVLVFRFDNPDALLVLLLLGSGYATLRAIEQGRTRWLVLAATLLGFAFLTKMLQPFLVVPALALVWLLVAPVGIGRRLRDLALAAVALVVSGGWWVLVVELWPAADRPFIGGSQDNGILELIFGYNGFGRLTGDEVGSVGGGQAGAGATGSWGETGITRLFGSEFAGQGAWLLPSRDARVGRMAPGELADLQSDGGHLPPLLPRGTGAGCRRADRDRLGGALAEPDHAGGPDHDGRARGGDGRLGTGPGSTSSGGSDDAQQIAQWVQETFTATTVGGTTLYDLSSAS